MEGTPRKAASGSLMSGLQKLNHLLLSMATGGSNFGIWLGNPGNPYPGPSFTYFFPRAVGNYHFCDTTNKASQRLFCSYKGGFPCITEVGRNPLIPQPCFPAFYGLGWCLLFRSVRMCGFCAALCGAFQGRKRN